MPAFWPDYPKSFYPQLGGDAEAQIRAIRDHLMTFRGGPSPKSRRGEEREQQLRPEGRKAEGLEGEGQGGRRPLRLPALPAFRDLTRPLPHASSHKRTHERANARASSRFRRRSALALSHA